MHRRTVTLCALTFLLVGCSSGPAATAPPGNPTPGPTGAAQSLAPGETGVPGAGAAACTLSSSAELASIFGDTWTQTESTPVTCTWTSTSFTTINVRYEEGDLTGARAILGNVQNVTVAGKPGLIGEFMGVLLYIQIGPNTHLVIQSVLSQTDDATKQKVIQLGTAAVGRI